MCALLILIFIAASSAYADGLRVLRDEETEKSLQIFARPILEQAGLAPSSVRFILIDSPDMNAFVAGGQNIFLNTGLILNTDNAGELIGVIAHETGHIAAGHLFRGNIERSDLSLQVMLSNLLGVAVAVASGAPGAIAAASSAGQSIAMRSLLRHTRTQEGSADQGGIRFLTSAHLPLDGFVNFMQKLSSQELLPESQQSEYVRTHPLTQDRVEALAHAAEQHKDGKTPDGWDDLHARLKAKLRGYIFPDRALQDRGIDIAAQYGRSLALFRKGQVEKALEGIDALIKIETKNPYFYELKGQVLFENGRADEAAKAYAEAAKLAPEAGLIHIAYAHSLIEGKTSGKNDLKKAVDELQQALKTEDDMTTPYHLLAIAYGKMGDEGMSRLYLAEEALMQNKPDVARREAGLARQALKKGTPAYLHADDILNAASEDRTKKKKEN